MTEIFIVCLSVIFALFGIMVLLKTVGSKARLDPPRCTHCGTILEQNTWCPACDHEERADNRPLAHHERADHLDPTGV